MQHAAAQVGACQTSLPHPCHFSIETLHVLGSSSDTPRNGHLPACRALQRAERHSLHICIWHQHGCSARRGPSRHLPGRCCQITNHYNIAEWTCELCLPCLPAGCRISEILTQHQVRAWAQICVSPFADNPTASPAEVHAAIVNATTSGRLDATMLRGTPNKMLYTVIPPTQASYLSPL